MERQHIIPGDLILKANAARALDAPFLVKENQVTQRNVLVQLHLVTENHPACARPVFQRLVLQRAFATLVANRAVERVARQEEFNHVLARSFYRLGGGADHQPIAHGSRTCGLQLRHPANLRVAVLVQQGFAGRAVFVDRPHFYKAHTAHADRLHLGVVTKDRDIVPDPFGGIDQIAALGNVVRLIVDVNLDRIRHSILQKDRARERNVRLSCACLRLLHWFTGREQTVNAPHPYINPRMLWYLNYSVPRGRAHRANRPARGLAALEQPRPSLHFRRLPPPVRTPCGSRLSLQTGRLASVTVHRAKRNLQKLQGTPVLPSSGFVNGYPARMSPGYAATESVLRKRTLLARCELRPLAASASLRLPLPHEQRHLRLRVPRNLPGSS